MDWWTYIGTVAWVLGGACVGGDPSSGAVIQIRNERNG